MGDANYLFHGDQPYRVTLSERNLIMLPNDYFAIHQAGKFSNAHFDKMVLAGLVEEGNEAPELTAPSSSVDDNLQLTFTDLGDVYLGAITDLLVDGESLDGGVWNTGSGRIRVSLPDTVVLQTPGTYTLTVVATGYVHNVVEQVMTAGAVANMEVTTQPIGPIALASPGPRPLTQQPVVRLTDRYGNLTDDAVTAEPYNADLIPWDLSPTDVGDLSVDSINGIATFTNLGTNTNADVPSAHIEFLAGGKTAQSDPFVITTF